MTITSEEQDFIEAFEQCTMAPGTFRHYDHVRMAWLYLRQYPITQALARYAEGLKRFARSVGQPGLYHETITYAFIFLINERIEQGDPGEAWEAFAARSEDLLTGGRALLEAYYRPEVLNSDRARKIFVMPAPARVATPGERVDALVGRAG